MHENWYFFQLDKHPCLAFVSCEMHTASMHYYQYYTVMHDAAIGRADVEANDGEAHVHKTIDFTTVSLLCKLRFYFQHK